MEVTGANSFKDNPIRVIDVQAIAAYPKHLILALHIQVFNPSVAALSPGPVGLGLEFMCETVATALIPEFNVYPGWNDYVNINSTLFQTTENEDAISEFMSLYSQGLPANVTIYALENSTIHEILKPALVSLVVPSSLPGINFTIIKFAEIQISLVDYAYGYVPTKLTVYNPFAIGIVLFEANLGVFLNGTYIGKVNQTLNVTVGANQTTITDPVNVEITGWTWEELEIFFGPVLLSINGTLNAIFGDGFVSPFYYSQINIPAYFWNTDGFLSKLGILAKRAWRELAFEKL